MSWSCLGMIAVSVGPATVCAAFQNDIDEQTIRSMVDQAISRLNKGDETCQGTISDSNAFEDVPTVVEGWRGG